MSQNDPGRGARVLTAIAVFLSLAGALVLVVSYRYLIPALAAAKGADPVARKQLAAISSLVLVVVLVCMFLMLVVLFRPGRMLLMRKSDPRTRTKYVDAWAEAGKRAQADNADEPDDPESGKPG